MLQQILDTISTIIEFNELLNFVKICVYLWQINSFCLSILTLKIYQISTTVVDLGWHRVLKFSIWSIEFVGFFQSFLVLRKRQILTTFDQSSYYQMFSVTSSLCCVRKMNIFVHQQTLLNWETILSV